MSGPGWTMTTLPASREAPRRPGNAASFAASSMPGRPCSWPPCTIRRAGGSLLVDIGPRRILDGHMAPVRRAHPRRVDRFARMLGEPGREGGPPRALARLGLRKPGLGIDVLVLLGMGPDPETAPRMARLADDPGIVPAARPHIGQVGVRQQMQ